MRVLVVGGGINGLLTARELVQAGHEVVLVERGDRIRELIEHHREISRVVPHLEAIIVKSREVGHGSDQ